MPVSDDGDWSPSGWAYTLDVDNTAWRYRADIAIPAGPPASLADLVPTTTTAPDPASTYVTKASVGTATGPAGPRRRQRADYPPGRCLTCPAPTRRGPT
ncbi:hypothetical protein [Salinispora arenicola]|uniref:hypothetical protein n=1 Tax=Salinispora arenicola TaxID=168697 RepID=UPI00168F3EEA|nr:hypothetical protein [Salinispora arenicola]NIL64779.1 hypothetical protein [Salinispora arenicola]